MYKLSCIFSYQVFSLRTSQKSDRNSHFNHVNKHASDVTRHVTRMTLKKSPATPTAKAGLPVAAAGRRVMMKTAIRIHNIQARMFIYQDCSSDVLSHSAATMLVIVGEEIT